MNNRNIISIINGSKHMRNSNEAEISCLSRALYSITQKNSRRQMAYGSHVAYIQKRNKSKWGTIMSATIAGSKWRRPPLLANYIIQKLLKCRRIFKYYKSMRNIYITIMRVRITLLLNNLMYLVIIKSMYITSSTIYRHCLNAMRVHERLCRAPAWC